MYPRGRDTGESLGSKGPSAPFFLQKSVVHLAFKISGAIAQEVKGGNKHGWKERQISWMGRTR